MYINRRQLATSILAASHLCDREVIAGFVGADTTGFAPNAFPQTSAGVVRYVWTQRASEFRPLGVIAVGLQGLLAALSEMDVDQPVIEEILRAGPHTANVFHHGDGVRIIGALLYGKPGVALPTPPRQDRIRSTLSRRLRALSDAGQLDLFAMGRP